MLRRCLLALGLLLGVLGVVPSPYALAEPAEPLVSREGRFSAVFPAQPVHDSSVRHTWAGRMEEGSYELEGGPFRLRVEFHDIPRLARAVMPPAVLLDLARDGVLEDTNAQRVTVQEISVRDHPGLALRYQPGGQPGTFEEARLYLVGSRLFVAFARSDDSQPLREAAQRFLASFDAWEAGEAVASAGGRAGAGM